jgi:hypothetical protein
MVFFLLAGVHNVHTTYCMASRLHEGYLLCVIIFQTLHNSYGHIKDVPATFWRVQTFFEKKFYVHNFYGHIDVHMDHFLDKFTCS